MRPRGGLAVFGLAAACGIFAGCNGGTRLDAVSKGFDAGGGGGSGGGHGGFDLAMPVDMSVGWHPSDFGMPGGGDMSISMGPWDLGTPGDGGTTTPGTCDPGGLLEQEFGPNSFEAGCCCQAVAQCQVLADPIYDCRNASGSSDSTNTACLLCQDTFLRCLLDAELADYSAGQSDPPSTPVCCANQPSCDGKGCNDDDGCGQPCETCAPGFSCDSSTDSCVCNCPSGQSCQSDGSCTCIGSCAGVACGGDDGCGGTCGCPSGTVCNVDGGTCDCVPDCQGRSCGSDGCGGTCGSACGSNQYCGTSGTCINQPPTACSMDAGAPPPDGGIPN
jgi:hypothetical protein